MTNKKLTILFESLDGVGHVNACIGLAQVLQKRGHRIVFAIEKTYKGKLSEFGFEEQIIDDNEDKIVKSKTQSPIKRPGEDGAEKMLKSGIFSGKSSLEKLKLIQKSPLFAMMIEKAKKDNTMFAEVVDKLNPDVIIIDDFIGRPALIHSGRPWVSVFSGSPLFSIDDDKTPPFGSGFPTFGDKIDWKEFRDLRKESIAGNVIKYNEWIQELGFPIHNSDNILPISPFLNIYGYPEELDYLDVRPIPDNFCPIDAFIRKDPKEFKIPDKFQNREKTNSKLIYLSMGSMGSVDVNLMKRFVDILSKTRHKYIISKGLMADKYELADNMWGEASVPQTNVLPLVDLVITHGGNNSVTETFSYGKPMIVMPLMGDQYDNAQRIHEKGFGIRLEPYMCSELDLLDSIEKLLNDKQLDERLSIASKRMLNSDSISKACERIERLVK
ncbi:NDP-glycosyltransferase YjiC-like [Oppia nitens]|uniref:NDP-glycosyltransferase YjiC-like n=1 Tax=Oppia nitens TaxID=1686743 RepID=UPI0023D98C41|nr:NDP-glycosyltransferase YjiC-like [Oppia nitens]